MSDNEAAETTIDLSEVNDQLAVLHDAIEGIAETLEAVASDNAETVQALQDTCDSVNTAVQTFTTLVLSLDADMNSLRRHNRLVTMVDWSIAGAAVAVLIAIGIQIW